LFVPEHILQCFAISLLAAIQLYSLVSVTHQRLSLPSTDPGATTQNISQWPRLHCAALSRPIAW